MKKRILKNIHRIWHLLKGNLPKTIIIWQPSDESARGLWYSRFLGATRRIIFAIASKRSSLH
jgi:hypothetical protein